MKKVMTFVVAMVVSVIGYAYEDDPLLDAMVEKCMAPLIEAYDGVPNDDQLWDWEVSCTIEASDILYPPRSEEHFTENQRANEEYLTKDWSNSVKVWFSPMNSRGSQFPSVYIQALDDGVSITSFTINRGNCRSILTSSLNYVGKPHTRDNYLDTVRDAEVLFPGGVTYGRVVDFMVFSDSPNCQARNIISAEIGINHKVYQWRFN